MSVQFVICNNSCYWKRKFVAGKVTAFCKNSVELVQQITIQSIKTYVYDTWNSSLSYLSWMPWSTFAIWNSFLFAICYIRTYRVLQATAFYLTGGRQWYRSLLDLLFSIVGQLEVDACHLTLFSFTLCYLVTVWTLVIYVCVCDD